MAASLSPNSRWTQFHWSSKPSGRGTWCSSQISRIPTNRLLSTEILNCIIPLHSLEWEEFLILGLLFCLYTVPQVFTWVFPIVIAGAHRRGIWLLYYLDDWLVITDSVPFLLQHRRVLLQLYNSHQYGEVRHWAHQQSSVSWNADRHHSTLSDYQIPRCDIQDPSPDITTCEDVAADSRPHALCGMFCSYEQGISGQVQAGSVGHRLIRTIHGHHHSQVHSEEEQHSSWSAKLSRSDSFYRVVSSSQGVRRHLQRLWLSSHQSVRHYAKHKDLLVHAAHSGSYDVETAALCDYLSIYAFPPFVLLR